MQTNRFYPLIFLGDIHNGVVKEPLHGKQIEEKQDGISAYPIQYQSDSYPILRPRSLPNSPRIPQIYADRIPLPFRNMKDESEFYDLIKVVSKKKRYSYPILPKIVTESYAIILISYARGDDDPTVLLGHRRESVEMANFIRGLYYPNELYTILSLMTISERKRLLEYDFDTLWDDYWPLDSSIFHRSKARQIAKAAYDEIKPFLSRLIQLTSSNNLDTEWLFPRGRAKRQLSGEAVAIQEFEEETKLSLKNAQKVPIDPYRELYYGSDGDIYATTHYVYITNTELLPPKRGAPVLRKWMVSNDFDTVSWFGINELEFKLNKQRFEMIKSIIEYLKSEIKITIDDSIFSHK